MSQQPDTDSVAIRVRGLRTQFGSQVVHEDLNLDVRRGVYAWMLGPSYETPAEVRMLRRFGADAVGMSTVPEVIQAQQLGMRVLGISTITNPAAGMGADRLDHEDVLRVGQQVRGDLTRLVRNIVGIG